MLSSNTGGGAHSYDASPADKQKQPQQRLHFSSSSMAPPTILSLLSHVVDMRDTLHDKHQQQRDYTGVWEVAEKATEELGDALCDMEYTVVSMINNVLQHNNNNNNKNIFNTENNHNTTTITLEEIVPSVSLRAKLLCMREHLVRVYTTHLDGLTSIQQQLGQQLALREERQRQQFNQTTEHQMYILMKDLDRIQSEMGKLSQKLSSLEEMSVGWMRHMERGYATPQMARVAPNGTARYEPKSTGGSSTASAAPVSAFSRRDEDEFDSTLASSMPPNAQIKYVHMSQNNNDDDDDDDDVVRFDIGNDLVMSAQDDSTPTSPKLFSSPVTQYMNEAEVTMSPHKLDGRQRKHRHTNSAMSSPPTFNGEIRGMSETSPLRLPVNALHSSENSPLKNPPTSPYIDAPRNSHNKNQSSKTTSALPSALALAFYQELVEQGQHKEQIASTPQHRRPLTTTPAATTTTHSRVRNDNDSFSVHTKSAGGLLSKIFTPKAQGVTLEAVAEQINESLIATFSSKCLFPESMPSSNMHTPRTPVPGAMPKRLKASPLPRVSFARLALNEKTLNNNNYNIRGFLSPAKMLIKQRHQQQQQQQQQQQDKENQEQEKKGEEEFDVVSTFDTSSAVEMPFSPPMQGERLQTKTPFPTPMVKQNMQRTPEKTSTRAVTDNAMSPFRLGNANQQQEGHRQVARPLLVMSPEMCKPRAASRQPDELGRSLELDLSMISNRDDTLNDGNSSEEDEEVTQSIADELEATVERIQPYNTQPSSSPIRSPVLGNVNPATILERTNKEHVQPNHLHLGVSVRLARR